MASSTLKQTTGFERREIASNTDLNDITKAGVYYSGNASISNSLLNCPVTGRGFVMIVLEKGYYSTTSFQTGQQIIFATTEMYFRASFSTGWEGWIHPLLSTLSPLSKVSVDTSALVTAKTLNDGLNIITTNPAVADNPTSSGSYMFYIFKKSTGISITAVHLGSHRIYTNFSNSSGKNWDGWRGLTYGYLTLGVERSGTFYFFALLTSNSKNLQIFVPLDYDQDVTAISITSLVVSARIPTGGYLIGSGADMLSYIDDVTVMRGQRMIKINLTKSDGFGATNNIPLTGALTMTYTLS